MNEKLCELYDRICINCGECEKCDLDPSKKCDNCMKCINGEEKTYRSIAIDHIYLEKEILERK